MLPYLPLGPFLLQTSGLALLVGVWIGMILAEKQAKKLKLNPELIYNLIFIGLVAGIVGSRLAYAARYLSAYLEDPLSLFSLNPNTLAPTDGLIIGLLAAVLYGQRKALPLRPTLDVLAPGLAALLVFVGLANLLSGNAFGAPTQAPWAIYLWEEYRHPTQVYQMLAALGVLILVWKGPVGKPGAGVNFLLTIALLAAVRLFLEAFRGDSLIWPGGFRAAQVISLLVLAATLWLMRLWTSNQPNGRSSQVPRHT